MYKRILLAYDGSLEGRIALREGAVLARRCRAEVFLLAVTPLITTPDALGAVSIEPEMYNEVLRDGLAKAREIGLNVTAELVHGDPVDEISAFAKKISADLVVVSHRRKSFLERWWSGPSQSYLTDKLGCSVLIARNVVSDQTMATEQALFSSPTA